MQPHFSSGNINFNPKDKDVTTSGPFVMTMGGREIKKSRSHIINGLQFTKAPSKTFSDIHQLFELTNSTLTCVNTYHTVNCLGNFKKVYPYRSLFFNILKYYKLQQSNSEIDPLIKLKESNCIKQIVIQKIQSVIRMWLVLHNYKLEERHRQELRYSIFKSKHGDACLTLLHISHTQTELFNTKYIKFANRYLSYVLHRFYSGVFISLFLLL